MELGPHETGRREGRTLFRERHSVRETARGTGHHALGPHAHASSRLSPDREPYAAAVPRWARAPLELPRW
ncbi:hypothetical protein ACWIGN_32675 [Streptomyces albidoflavus]